MRVWQERAGHLIAEIFKEYIQTAGIQFTIAKTPTGEIGTNHFPKSTK